MQKKAIVTGANGFVGSAICKSLIESGIKTIAVVRDSKSDLTRITGIKGIQIVHCSMNEYKTLQEIIADRDIDVAYLLAWEGSAGELRGNENIQLNNVKYTCDAVRTLAKMGCKRVVFASSIMKYEVMTLMKTTNSPTASAIYSSAKMAADYFGRIVAAREGIEYISAIISNIYGPGENSPRLVNSSIRKLLGGEHCSFSTGEQLYDFIYIEDAAEAFVLLGNKGKNNGTYYIGSASPKPLKDYLESIRDIVAPDAALGFGEMPFNGVSLNYNEFDINALREDTGFIPKNSFEDGIKKTRDWIKRNENESI